MSVPGYQRHYTPLRPHRSGMAMASLILGLAGLPALVLCGLGLPMAMIGLALGVVAAARGTGRGMAIAGICACMLTLLVGALAIFWLLSQAAECADPARYPSDADRQKCIEREFPFARSNSPPA